MAVSIIKLGACLVQAATDNTSLVAVNTFWKEKPCVLAILRRFGCQFCRMEAVELSRFEPVLNQKGVRLIAIGHDVDGLEDFQAARFFTGELYLDPQRSTYKALGYKRVSMFSGVASLFRSKGRALIHETRDNNVKGNFEGDGWQLGGLLIIEKGGNVAYSFKQEEVADKPDYDKIREIFGISKEELLPLHVP